MASPASSAALMTSSSRIEPPGWITAVAPASDADRGAVLRIDDRVRLRMLRHLEGEQHIGDLLCGGRAFGHDLEILRAGLLRIVGLDQERAGDGAHREAGRGG